MSRVPHYLTILIGPAIIIGIVVLCAIYFPYKPKDGKTPHTNVHRQPPAEAR